MKKNRKYSKNHWITILVFLSMFLSIYGSEWTLNTVGFYINAICQILPVACCFLLTFFTGAFGFGQKNNSLNSWYNVGVIAVLLILLLQALGLMGYNNVPRSELGIIQAIFICYMGYWIAGDTRELYWLLKQLAGLSIIMSLLAAMNSFGVHSKSYMFFPSWQTRLVILFGYCWYLYLWLTGEKIFSRSALWLIICSLAIWVTFHKPILFAALFSTIFTFLLVLKASKKKAAIYSRILVLFVLVFFSLAFVNYYTSGAMMKFITTSIYKNILHVNEGTPLNEFQFNILEQASGGRFDIWSMAIEQFRDNPLLGGGRKTDWAWDSTHVHNWYLDMLLWVGVIGFFPFLAGLIWWFRLSIKKTVLSEVARTSIPSMAYIVGLMAYNLGGSMRSFFSITSFAVLIMALSARPAQNALRIHKSRVKKQLNNSNNI